MQTCANCGAPPGEHPKCRYCGVVSDLPRAPSGGPTILIRQDFASADPERIARRFLAGINGARAIVVGVGADVRYIDAG